MQEKKKPVGQLHFILVKTKKHLNDTYIKQEGNGDTYFHTTFTKTID